LIDCFKIKLSLILAKVFTEEKNHKNGDAIFK